MRFHIALALAAMLAGSASAQAVYKPIAPRPIGAPPVGTDPNPQSNPNPQEDPNPQPASAVVEPLPVDARANANASVAASAAVSGAAAANANQAFIDNITTGATMPGTGGLTAPPGPAMISPGTTIISPTGARSVPDVGVTGADGTSTTGAGPVR